jgi:hypothetical protein
MHPHLWSARVVSVLACMICVITVSKAGTAFQVIDVPEGKTVDTYFEINLSGYVSLSIRDKNGPACADLWWITWPLGWVKEIGRKCGNARLDIPGWRDLSLWSKLRARGAGQHTKIIVSENSEIANTITLSFP